nr:FtsW/RodA/SpoVE family cell cycle protein [Kitasatospora sp. SID7827]
MLLLAVAVCLAGWTSASLALRGTLPPDLARYGAGLGALALLLHLAVRRFTPYADPLILPLAVLLSGFGLVLLDRLDHSYALWHAAKGDWQKLPAAPAQVRWTVIAALLAIAVLALTDPFGKLLATGLAAALALQVFVVTGVVTGLIPLTGKALPFLAAGGSSLTANWLLTAILIKLSDAAGRTELEPAAR